ncbi:MAG: type II secretion system protein N [Pseudomonadota bacterium]
MGRWILLFAGTALLAVLVQFPLSLALRVSGAPVAADRVTGSVWAGRIEGATVQGYALGDVDVSAKLLPLITGRLVAAVDIEGPIARGHAVVTAQSGSLKFDETEAAVNIAPLALRDAFGAPMSGIVNLTADELELSADGRCLGGRAGLSTDTLQRSAVRYGGEGFQLSGEGACQDGVFILPLAGMGPEGSADVTIRVSRAGYQTEVVFVPTDQQLAAALSAYGFERDGGQYSLIQRGDVF